MNHTISYNTCTTTLYSIDNVEDLEYNQNATVVFESEVSGTNSINIENLEDKSSISFHFDISEDWDFNYLDFEGKFLHLEILVDGTNTIDVEIEDPSSISAGDTHEGLIWEVLFDGEELELPEIEEDDLYDLPETFNVYYKVENKKLIEIDYNGNPV